MSYSMTIMVFVAAWLAGGWLLIDGAARILANTSSSRTV